MELIFPSYIFEIVFICGNFLAERWESRKNRKKLESGKVDKSATIFWTQKPEGLSHVGRKIFSFSFPCLKNLEGRLGLISWFVSFAVFFEGTKKYIVHCYLYINGKFSLPSSKQSILDKATFEIDSLTFKRLSLWGLQFWGSCFHRNLLRTKSDIITTRVILLRFRVRAYMW